jgi:hypothetical protein
MKQTHADGDTLVMREVWWRKKMEYGDLSWRLYSSQMHPCIMQDFRRKFASDFQEPILDEAALR